jgi:hypothetical protein
VPVLDGVKLGDAVIEGVGLGVGGNTASYFPMMSKIARFSPR